MTIKVLVNGAFGKMGQMTVQAITQQSRLELVGQVARGYDLANSIKDSKAQVVVDFTHPNAVYDNTRIIIESGAHPVIGTTGLKQEQIKSLQKQCADIQLGGIIAPNFSISAVLLMKYAQEIAGYLPEVEIIESHHPQKADSPSGSALYAAEMIAKSRGQQRLERPTLHETVPGARGADYKGIPIHALRLPGMLAHLEIIFGNTGETLTLRHDSIDRACFMPGVCLACEKVVSLKEMVYGLEHVI
jgi:4-hydroxy-tetrahydrodipicolinate reductase